MQSVWRRPVAKSSIVRKRTPTRDKVSGRRPFCIFHFSLFIYHSDPSTPRTPFSMTAFLTALLPDHEIGFGAGFEVGAEPLDRFAQGGLRDGLLDDVIHALGQLSLA